MALEPTSIAPSFMNTKVENLIFVALKNSEKDKLNI